MLQKQKLTYFKDKLVKYLRKIAHNQVFYILLLASFIIALNLIMWHPQVKLEIEKLDQVLNVTDKNVLVNIQYGPKVSIKIGKLSVEVPAYYRINLTLLLYLPKGKLLIDRLDYEIYVDDKKQLEGGTKRNILLEEGYNKINLGQFVIYLDETLLEALQYAIKNRQMAYTIPIKLKIRVVKLVPLPTQTIVPEYASYEKNITIIKTLIIKIK